MKEIDSNKEENVSDTISNYFLRIIVTLLYIFASLIYCNY